MKLLRIEPYSGRDFSGAAGKQTFKQPGFLKPRRRGTLTIRANQTDLLSESDCFIIESSGKGFKYCSEMGGKLLN